MTGVEFEAERQLGMLISLLIFILVMYAGYRLAKRRNINAHAKEV